jgi:hypothetical protein
MRRCTSWRPIVPGRTAGWCGEVFALVALCISSDSGISRVFVLFATIVLLAAVAAAPAWTWWRAFHAVMRQHLLPPPKATAEDPAFGYGGRLRALWTARDRDAERIRIVLRDAGCPEFGKRRGGFAIEGGETGDHFYVACTMDNTDRAATELKTYVEALVAAGFRVEPDIDQVLRVWGAGVGQAG